MYNIGISDHVIFFNLNKYLKFSSIDFSVSGSKGAPPETKSFLESLFESFDDFMVDPDNAPKDTPPLGPPPSGPPPVPVKNNNQKEQMTAAMFAALLAVRALLGQFSNHNKNGGSFK